MNQQIESDTAMILVQMRRMFPAMDYCTVEHQQERTWYICEMSSVERHKRRAAWSVYFSVGGGPEDLMVWADTPEELIRAAIDEANKHGLRPEMIAELSK